MSRRSDISLFTSPAPAGFDPPSAYSTNAGGAANQHAPHNIDLTGWALLDTQKKRLELANVLPTGTTRTVRIQQPFALSNKGGVITLVDDKGLKVDGVSYTKEQARHPGWTIVF